MTTLRVTPVAALTDNYIWMVHDASHAACVDPGEARPVLDWLEKHELTLDEIWVTHGHQDHIGAVNELADLFANVRVRAPKPYAQDATIVAEGDAWTWNGARVTAWHIPGHTAEHMAYLLEDASGSLHVFCGDTLFSGGCGRVFSGSLEALYASLARLNTLPPDTLFYPAHEYTAANLRFAQSILPNQAAIEAALEAARVTPTLPVTLAHERLINVFLQCDDPKVASAVDLAHQDAREVFQALRRRKDRF